MSRGSSVSVSTAGEKVRLAAVPLTFTVSLPSISASACGISENVAAPLVAFAGIVNVKVGTDPKSTPESAVPPPTDTMT